MGCIIAIVILGIFICLLSVLRHMNGYFVGTIIYEDDITLLGPIRSSILSMLNVCCVYAKNIDYFIQSGEKQLYIFPAHPNSLPLHFMKTNILFVHC